MCQSTIEKQTIRTETNGYGVSLRVDGEFTSEFRDKLFGQGSKWMTLKEKDYDNYRKVWH